MLILPLLIVLQAHTPCCAHQHLFLHLHHLFKLQTTKGTNKSIPPFVQKHNQLDIPIDHQHLVRHLLLLITHTHTICYTHFMPHSTQHTTFNLMLHSIKQ